MAILSEIKRFLINDTSGAVTGEWTILTALLTIAAVSTVGTFSAGVHVVAYAVETEINVDINGGSGGGAGGGDDTNGGGTINALG